METPGDEAPPPGIEVVKNYDIAAFRTDLVVLYNTAGVEGTPIQAPTGPMAAISRQWLAIGTVGTCPHCLPVCRQPDCQRDNARGHQQYAEYR